MDARTYLKELRDKGWYLGDTAGASRQYVHSREDGVITVCLRHTDALGPEAQARLWTPGTQDADGSPEVVMETTRTGASAYCSDLPGVFATGPDELSTRERMSQAVALHRKALGS